MSTHPILSQIYGLDAGVEKFAAYEAYEEDDNEEFDLSQYSASELAEVLAVLEEEEAALGEEAEIEKMADDGTFQLADRMGRIQAHAYYDELTKLAGDDGGYEDAEYYSLDDIGADDLVELIESGEFELVDMEKEAGVRSALKSAWHGTGRGAAEAAGRAGARGRAAAGSAWRSSPADVAAAIRRGGGSAKERALASRLMNTSPAQAAAAARAAERSGSGRVGKALADRIGFLRRQRGGAAVKAQGGRASRLMDMLRGQPKHKARSAKYDRNLGRVAIGTGIGAAGAAGAGGAYALKKRNE